MDTSTDTATNKPKTYIDYSSGNLKVTFASGSALMEDSSTLVDYRYDNRQIGDGAIGTNQLQIPDVSIRIDSMPVLEIIWKDYNPRAVLRLSYKHLRIMRVVLSKKAIKKYFFIKYFRQLETEGFTKKVNNL